MVGKEFLTDSGGPQRFQFVLFLFMQCVRRGMAGVSFSFSVYYAVYLCIFVLGVLLVIIVKVNFAFD